ncbi:alpha-2-macroglobulin family protein [Botryobacter ruber]|uniref:alpha-2-macroglobulin family protein n=1 Tax=Botryobacter ruber TaxID=2171629 RepID=UPI000FEC7CC6|nr:hypothetical protein [Botryobacter ruber]
MVDVVPAAEVACVPAFIFCKEAHSKSGRGAYEVHREYNRHKVAIFCDRLPQGKHTYTVQLLPRYSGTYTLNPAKAELMYFPTFFGRTGVKQVEVR